MAVDSAAKRFSMLDFGRPGYPMVLVPDGTVGETDRADLLGLYAGLSLANVATILGTNFMVSQATHYTMADQAVHYVMDDQGTHYVIRKVES